MKIYIDARGGEYQTLLAIEACLEEASRQGYKYCIIKADVIGFKLVGYTLEFLV